MKIKSSSFQQRVVLGVIFVLIFVYAFYHMTSLFGEDIETYAAGVTTETTVISDNGYIFRDEVLLTSSFAGTVDYRVQSGVKVAEGQEIAEVYENGSAQTREAILLLDTQISLLEQSLGDSLKTAEMGAIKKSVGNSYDSLMKLLALKDAGGLAASKDTLLVGLNQMSGLAEGESYAGYETLERLRAQREELLSSGGASRVFCAEQSGYFYAQTDGYEEAFTMRAAKELTARSFLELTEQEPTKTLDGAKVFGKLAYSSEWMLVLPVEWKERDYFEIGSTYEAEFFQNNETVVPLTLENIVEDEERSRVLLVFCADRLPANFTFDRSQSVRLTVDRVSGIYVPKNVVERSNGVRGVYVLRGNVVHFRRIEILYTGEDYYLVKSGVEHEEYTYLQVNDLIILNGKNMFDGRVLD